VRERFNQELRRLEVEDARDTVILRSAAKRAAHEVSGARCVGVRQRFNQKLRRLEVERCAMCHNLDLRLRIDPKLDPGSLLRNRRLKRLA
jgi:hypothetical protein